MKRNQIFAIVVGSLMLGLLLVACRGAGSSGNPAAAGASTATVGSPTLPPVATTSPALPVVPVATPLPSPEIASPTPITITVTVEVTRPPLGSSGRPVQLLFPPVTSSAVIVARAEPLVEALRATTGVEFTVGIADSEAALVELLCNAPEDIVGFVSAAAYTIAHDQCDAQAGLVAVHEDGLTWQMGMLAVARGAAGELADLAGKRWAVADTRSLPNYLYFRAQMAAAGIEPGEIVDAPEDTSALQALHDGTVDFTTADFIPPIMPMERAWVVGETEPEEWRYLGIAPSRSPIGYVVVAGDPEYGGYRLRDARARMFDTTPDIFDVTRILAVSDPFPNETVVMGANFPLGLARQTLATLTEFAASDACGNSLCSADLFGWAGLEPVDDSAYDPIRIVKDTLELEAADLWAELD